MKKLIVNTEGCIGCGACVGIEPEHFDFNEDGLSHVISEENLDSSAIQDAIAACPVQVISLEETEEEQNSVTSLEETDEKQTDNVISLEETDDEEKAA